MTDRSNVERPLSDAEIEILATHLIRVTLQLLAKLSPEDRRAFLCRRIFDEEGDRTRH